MKKTVLTVLGVMSAGMLLAGGESKLAAIALPAPALGAATLKTALENRRTTRQFSTKPLPQQELSNLLWAADGVNRPDGKLVVPAARGLYAIVLYVALPEGVYRYDRARNTLHPVSDKDIRAMSDGRKMGTNAPVVVISVADDNVFGREPRGLGYTGMEAGAIMQNLYLYCAAAGLNTVVCGSFNQAEIDRALQLPENHRVILTQVVGYPRD